MLAVRVLSPEKLGSALFLLFIFCLPVGVAYLWQVLLAHTSVSTVINGCLSMLFLVLIESKNFILSFVPFVGAGTKLDTLSNGQNIFWAEGIDIFFYVLTFPMLLLFAAGSILALGKKYWIERYNDGRDIEYLLPNTDKI